MKKEEIYKTMGASDSHHATVEMKDGKCIPGYVDVFESRYDNEDEEDEEIRGKGTIIFYPNEGDPMLLTEDDILSIKITDRI